MNFIRSLTYNVGFGIFSMLYLPLFILKGKAGHGVSARFGRPSREMLAKLNGGNVVWLHAVSVGEIGLALRWAAELKTRMPEAKILFTTTTVTGYQVASKIKADEDTLCYFPIDWGWAVSSFVNKVSPSLVLLFETEIWPNLIGVLAKKGIPVFIVNGRISDRAYRRYVKVKGFLKPVLEQLTGIGVQDEAMRERFIQLGADAARVRVTGNLKFEWTPLGARREKAPNASLTSEPSVFTWLCASTHEGEEEIVIDIYKRLAQRYPMRLVLAPRHVDRVDAIEKAAVKKGVAVQRYSRGFTPQSKSGEIGLYLIDAMGVLVDLYPIADAVLIGGSLVPVGGHNPVEAAYFGKPVVYGKHMQNFKSMTEEFEKEQAAYCAESPAALEAKLVEWISDRHKRAAIGEAAKNLVGRHRGATQNNLDYVLPVLEQSFGRRLINV